MDQGKRIEVEVEAEKENIMKELSEGILKWLNNETDISDLLRLLNYSKGRWDLLTQQTTEFDKGPEQKVKVVEEKDVQEHSET